MGQTDIMNFLIKNYPKRYTAKELSIELGFTQTSIRRCCKILSSSRFKEINKVTEYTQKLGYVGPVFKYYALNGEK